MCGIAGILRRDPQGVSPERLLRMAATLRHRGPDGYGYYAGRRVGLSHTRLSIVDLEHGAQPMLDASERLVVVFNGEIYNHVELRHELQSWGRRFRTRSDTEVLLHGYAIWGERMLERLNGQFAFAIYDRSEERVFLARDRFGIRPLVYAERGDELIFASEAKALFAAGVPAAPDLEGLREVYTMWAARPPRTVFRGVRSLGPGCCATWQAGELRVRRYYQPDYREAEEEDPRALDQLNQLLRDSVSLRLRADVPVGAYLSGGLDSTITSALATVFASQKLRTFSVGFDDPMLDESVHQAEVARAIRSEHAARAIGNDDIARAFPEVIYHTETPLVRTAPVPLYLLAQLTRQKGLKVVLTGEGADELFLGYDLFKETAVRLFCLRSPDSKWRPLLFDRLYPYLGNGAQGPFWRNFFLQAGDPDDPLFSHLPRFGLTAWITDFLADGIQDAGADYDPLDELRGSLPAGFGEWSPLNRAAYLEMETLLSPYLLSSQGDRMSLAHGVEGRFPFLDHRIFELTASLPTRSKLRVLREKDILRRWAGRALPNLPRRDKQPFRASDVSPFFSPTKPYYVRGLLDPDTVRDVGLFEPRAVDGLVRRCESGKATGFRETQALVAVLSTQLWYHTFMGKTQAPAPLKGRPDVAIEKQGRAGQTRPTPQPT